MLPLSNESRRNPFACLSSLAPPHAFQNLIQGTHANTVLYKQPDSFIRHFLGFLERIAACCKVQGWNVSHKGLAVFYVIDA